VSYPVCTDHRRPVPVHPAGMGHDPNFPQSEGASRRRSAHPGLTPADGPDHVVGQHHGQGVDNLKRPDPENTAIDLMKQFVTVTGGRVLLLPAHHAIEGWGS
jgi:hypothetical protein